MRNECLTNIYFPYLDEEERFSVTSMLHILNEERTCGLTYIYIYTYIYLTYLDKELICGVSHMYIYIYSLTYLSLTDLEKERTSCNPRREKL